MSVRIGEYFASDPKVLARVEHLSGADAVRPEVSGIHLRYANVDGVPRPYRILGE
jgi:hypothetical protein